MKNTILSQKYIKNNIKKTESTKYIENQKKNIKANETFDFITKTTKQTRKL